MYYIDVLEKVGETWHCRRMAREELLRYDEHHTHIIFIASEAILSSDTFRRTLSTRYMIPDHFWTDTYQRSNGFFGCQDTYDEEGKLKIHTTWFRILVKQVETSGGTNRHAYEWYEMGFFTRWTSKGGHLLICFDTPLILRDRLKSLFLSPSIIPKLSDIYSLHMLAIGEIIKLFNKSVWSLRDIVRATEKNRLRTVQYGPNFPLLHDFARHTIHSSESLDVAIDTMSGILGQYEWFSDTGRSYMNLDSVISRRTQQHLSFQIQTMRSLRARSKANEARLRNEIDLAFNTIAQIDSKTMVKISGAVQHDSIAMKTIAILTLIFLPATFVSAVFSMTFFNFSPKNQDHPEAWVVSNKIWIYWVISLPLTIITVFSWFMWQRKIVRG